MNVAILTGASSGLGYEYFKNLVSMNGIEEIWLIARREDRLNEMASSCSKKCRVVSLDLTDRASLNSLKELLEAEKPNVKILVNNAGFGKLGYVDELDYNVQMDIVTLNAAALSAVSAMTIPYMQAGSYILNVCSIASFCPNPRMSVYSASKAYVMSFTKSLRYELKERKINVCAVCPGPMETEFLPVAGITGENSRTFSMLPYSNPISVASVSLKKAAKGKAVYTPGAFYKFYRLLAKLLPHNLLMPMSKT